MECGLPVWLKGEMVYNRKLSIEEERVREKKARLDLEKKLGMVGDAATSARGRKKEGSRRG